MKVCTDSCLFGAWVAEHVGRQEGIGRVLDIGTGTGLLSLMLAQKSAALIEAIEPDASSFAQAYENIGGSPWPERILVYPEFAQQYKPSGKYDIILSNPPFFEDHLLSSNEQRNTAMHSVSMAPGDLLQCFAEWLTDEGEAFILLPFHRQESFLEEAKSFSLFATEVVLVRQTSTHGFFRSMIRLSANDTKTAYGEIIIRENDGHYSKAFTDLLSEYYLRL